MKGKWVWLSFDGLEYELWRKKPTWDGCDYFWNADQITTYCQDEFESITRYKLKEGECKRVRFIVEEK